MMNSSVRPTPTATPIQTVGAGGWDCAKSLSLLDSVFSEGTLLAVGMADVGCEEGPLDAVVCAEVGVELDLVVNVVDCAA
jgi:hypothetical protein